jgi:diguanylate cyclase (GGDEF)-like protein
LAVAIAGLTISFHMQSVHREVLERHAILDRRLQNIDQIADQFSPLFQAGHQATAEELQQLATFLGSLDATSEPGRVLPDLAPELPTETKSVQQAIGELDRALKAQPGGERGQPSLSAPAAHLELALTTLRSGVDQLDQANLERLNESGQARFWEVVLAGGALLLIVLTLIYGIQLHRQIRREELARYGVEAELAAERQALEERVSERTQALEAEARVMRRSERLNRGRNRVLEMLARNEPSLNMLKALVDTVAEFRSTWLCAIHVLDGGWLKLMASSGIKDKLAHHLRSISIDFTDAPESAALAAGHLRLIGDLSEQHKPWPELLRANSLQSVWSAPFLAPGSTPLGTLTVYALLKQEPSPADIEVMEMACQMAALVLERRRLQSQLIEHAYHDSLTGLPNRRLGEDRLSNATKRAARASHRAAVLWIDLNRFKQVNDLYGHPIGDAVLQQTAKRLASRLRASDTLARMGGDEFMVILEEIKDRHTAEQTAIDLLDVVAAPMQIDDLEIAISASIGVSLYPDDGNTVDSLAQHADRAMYAAKFGGCGVLSFSPDMDREPAERRELESELSLALENGGFSVAYQPQCLPDGTLVGFEALLRFNSPRLGNIPPAQFIPIAEETGLIVPIGEWVLREVCRQSKKWRDANHTMVPIAVNISAIEFDREDFADSVARILAETGQTPAMLVLELTESIVMHDTSESTRQMNRLKQLGVRIAIDDFGTGYSSLSYLHRLPIDLLKIDRSFIETLTEPEGTRPIVEAVLSMAHSLGYCVVAEGVETTEQLSSLKKNSCDIIQGYLFSRPVKPDAAAGFLVSGKLEEILPFAPPPALEPVFAAKR